MSRRRARIGNPRWRIALFHILPNILPALLVQATLSIAAAIIAEAALSFLGLGQQPPAPSWGSMLNSAQRFLTNAPWMAIWPGLAIFLAVLSFNLRRRRPARRARSAGAVSAAPARSAIFRHVRAKRTQSISVHLQDNGCDVLRRYAPRNDASDAEHALLDHHFPHHAAAIHLVFEVDHRRAGEVPGQAGTRRAAADHFIAANGWKSCTV